MTDTETEKGKAPPVSFAQQLAALFDLRWYSSMYMGGEAASFAQAMRHFMEHGAARYFNPHPLFFTEFYLGQLLPHERQGVNILEHYLHKGAALGLSPFPLFDPAWYAETYKPENDGLTPFVHYLLQGVPRDLNPNSLFDAAWYKARHAAAVEKYGGYAAFHYLLTAHVGRQDPGPDFSSSEYMWLYDIQGMNPLSHYLNVGRPLYYKPKISVPDYSRICPATIERAAAAPREKIVICTALAGEYSQLLPHTHIHPSYRYVCFTDRERETWGLWETLPFPEQYDDPTRTSRYPKLNLPKLFPDADWLIWVDANVLVNGDLSKYVRAVEESGAPVGFIRHPYRDCIYEEAKACAQANKDAPENLQAHVDYYRRQGFPRHAGLWENNVFIVNRGHKQTRPLFAMWWKEFRTHSRRDQISLPYVLNRLNVKPYPYLGDKNTRNHEDFIYLVHKETERVVVPPAFPRRLKK